jgi:signal transduction histidine kinase
MPAPTATPVSATELRTDELRDRIAWLIRLRWLAAAGVIAVVWTAPRLVGVPLPRLPLHLITAGLACYNALLWALDHWVPRVTRGSALFWFANLQVSVDLVFLTALLHFSGGIENPFTCYFVFHVVIASVLLRRSAAYLQTALAVALLSGLAALEASGRLPHYHLPGLHQAELYRSPAYVFAILFVIGTMLVFTAFMATSITARLRYRENQIVRLSASLHAHTNELEQAYEALRQLEKQRTDYLHRVAHHLRSPLAAAETMLAVVSEGRTGPIPEKAKEMVDRTRVRLSNMLVLARDLLALSRAREASALAHRETVDLRALLSAMESEFREQAWSAFVTLELTGDAGLPSITGARDSLAELLDNLVSNAIKYTPAGGRITISLRRRDQGIEVAVSDTGIGIPQEEREMIFQDFYRASNARQTKQDGTGLGLSIVRAIAEAHGGRVGLESEVGKGTTFRVWLPAAPTPPA